MIGEGPEGRRKRRLALPALTWLSVLFGIVTLVVVVLLVVYVVGGSDITR